MNKALALVSFYLVFASWDANATLKDFETLVLSQDIEQVMRDASESNSSIFVLDIDVGGTAPSIEFSQVLDDVRLENRYLINLKSLEKGVYFGVLPPSTYQINLVKAPYYGMPFQLRVTNDNLWRFNIESNKTNYVGKLTIESSRQRRSVNVALINRLANYYYHHKQKHASLLAKFPLVSSHSTWDQLPTQFLK